MTIKRRLLTLVFVRDVLQKKVLLGFKKRGFGMNKWNGLGGKVEPNETIVQSAIRECKEESTLDVRQIKQIGFIEFQFESQMNESLDVHVFCVDDFSGTPQETEEIRPKWFDYDQIPFDLMWKDDRHWFPYMLANQPFKGYFLFKDDQETILEQRLEPVNTLSEINQ